MVRDELDGTATAARSTVVLTSRAPAAAARAALNVATSAGDRTAADRLVVVTPNELAARALGVGHQSLTSLALSALRGRDLRFAGPLTRRAALRAAVADTWGSEDVVGTARSVESTIAALLRAGAGMKGVSVVAGFPRLSRALELVHGYRRHLALDGLVDREEALWLAANEARGDGRTVLVAGYPLLGPDELAFLIAFAAAGSVVVLPQAARATHARWPSPVAADAFEPNEVAAATLAERGWRVVRDDAEEAAPVPGPGAAARGSAPVRLRGYELAALDDEVRFVLTQVKELLLAGVPAADIALAAADPRLYGPAVAAVAREYGVAVRLAYKLPLASTPVGYLVTAITGAVVARLPFEETARLLMHHLVTPLKPDEWDRARSRHPGGPGAWEQVDQRARLLSWPRRATRYDYADRLEATLEGLGTLAILEDDAKGKAHLSLLFKALRTHAAAVSTSATAVAAEPQVSLATFSGELLDQLQLIGTSLDARGSLGADSVPLLPLTGLTGAALPHVFVLGAAEGVVPARLDAGARLDFVEREAARSAGLALADATLGARQQALTFDGVVRAAGASLTLSYPQVDGQGGQLPSPYFAALGIVPLAPESPPGGGAGKVAASLEELRRDVLATGDRASLAADVVLAGARHALTVEARRESAQPPDEYDGVIGEPYATGSNTFSATQLLALGQCTFKWFAQYGLRLHEPEEASDELSPLVRGNLYHQALDRAISAVMDANLAAGRPPGQVTREAVHAALPDAFAVAERNEAVYTVNWQLHRGQHLAALRRLVMAESFLPDGTEVIRSEALFGSQHSKPATWRGFAVGGRVDRIDRRGGVLTLVDYKTSSSRQPGAKDATGEAKLDLQLPIYLEAAVPALGLAEPVHTGDARSAAAGSAAASSAAAGSAAAGSAAAEYYSLTKSRVIASTSLTGENAFDRDALDAFATRSHAALAEGRYPVEPDRQRQACSYCVFDAVCRVGPRVERKRSDDG